MQLTGTRTTCSVKIALRMDDITPGMDWKKFLRFKELCDLYQVKPLIGVVPDNQDSMLEIDGHRKDYWDYLLSLEKDGWILAMHGVNHVYTTKKGGLFPLNNFSEFAGVAYEKQYEMLRAGRDILEKNGIKTSFFMAPGHSYDKNTLKALSKLGFNRITDGFGEKPYIDYGMTFYPISFKQSSSLRKKSGYTTFVIHANTMNDKDFERYEKLLRDNADKFISYSEYIEQPAVRRGLIGRLAEYFLAALKHMLVSL